MLASRSPSCAGARCPCSSARRGGCSGPARWGVRRRAGAFARRRVWAGPSWSPARAGGGSAPCALGTDAGASRSSRPVLEEVALEEVAWKQVPGSFSKRPARAPAGAWLGRRVALGLAEPARARRGQAVALSEAVDGRAPGGGCGAGPYGRYSGREEGSCPTPSRPRSRKVALGRRVSSGTSTRSSPRARPAGGTALQPEGSP